MEKLKPEDIRPGEPETREKNVEFAQVGAQAEHSYREESMKQVGGFSESHSDSDGADAMYHHLKEKIMDKIDRLGMGDIVKDLNLTPHIVNNRLVLDYPTNHYGYGVRILQDKNGQWFRLTDSAKDALSATDRKRLDIPAPLTQEMLNKLADQVREIAKPNSIYPVE